MVTWQNYVFQFIPEAIILVSIGVSLFKYPYIRTLPKILLAAMIHATSLFILWQMGFPPELRMILAMTIFLLSVWIGFRFSAIHAIIFTLSGIILAVVTEYLNAYMVYMIFGLNYQTVLQDPTLRLYVPYIYFLLMGLITLGLYKSKIKIPDNFYQGKRAYIFSLGLLGAFQILLLMMLSFQLHFLNESQQPVFSVEGIPLYIFIILVIFALSFVIVKKWYNDDIKKAVSETETTYQTELQNLIALMRSNHHDIYNHIQVIHGLHSIKAYEEANQYLNQLVQEINLTNLTVQIENKALSILFHSKMMMAQAQNIELKLNVRPDRYNLVPSIDQIRIYSNLIDNAFEASNKGSSPYKRVIIRLENVNDAYVFQVENTGPTIIDTVEIFEAGFSTNHEPQTRRGLGLSIVQQMVKKYNGTIEVHSNENVTSFTVVLPYGKTKEHIS